MKLTIQAEGVKRDINGPFEILATASDLRALREQIDLILAKENYCYGWNTIWPAPVSAAPNSQPRKWKDS